MESLGDSLALVLTFSALFAMVIGTAVGILVGALPGLGAPIALTLLLPFTFGLDQIPAITLLLGAYAGSMYGGSISAILINTPGTLAAASTILDGYPMAVRGEASRALGFSLVASTFGGLFSTIVLIFAAPQLAAVALKFGPVETFATIFLAMTCIATISRGSMVKGLLAGSIGLFLATVGSDPVTGDMRFDFGYFPLTSGIGIVPVIVGMFALTEVYVRVLQKAGPPVVTRDVAGITIPGWSEWRPRIGLLFKSSGIGSLVGILPGTGSAAAAFISYAEAKRSSPRSDKFGTGEPDGIISAEAANNAVTGGALVPTLALGIPGDGVTALMVTSLIIHGVTPGVHLMSRNPELVIALFIALFIVNGIMFFEALLAARLFSRLLRTPEPLLLAGVIVLCVVGAYGTRGNFFDLWVMLVASVVGFGLRLQDVPLPPLIIGLVLGPQFELTMRQGLIITDGSFLAFFTNYPVALGIFVVTGALLLFPILFRSRRHRPADPKGS